MRFLFAFEIKKFNSFIFLCTFRYEAEAIYFDEGVRTAKQEQLESKLLQVMPPNKFSCIKFRNFCVISALCLDDGRIALS